MCSIVTGAILLTILCITNAKFTLKPGSLQEITVSDSINVKTSYNILGVKQPSEIKEQYSAIDEVPSLKEILMRDLRQSTYEDVSLFKDFTQTSEQDRKNSTTVVLFQIAKNVVLI